MNQIEIGKKIAQLRKEAGYTQQQLADLLLITDKAVSKWERGLAMPDCSLLSKLSTLLDADIEYIISGNENSTNKWVGLIQVDDLRGKIAGKPVVHFLVAYFMLVRVKDIFFITKDEQYIRKLHLEQFGLNIYFGLPEEKKAIIIYKKFFLFGAHLTRQFETYTMKEHDIVPYLYGVELPLIFCHKVTYSIDYHRQRAEQKNMARGMVFIDISEENNNDISTFISLFEKYQKGKIYDLEEIHSLRKQKMLSKPLV